MAAFGEYCPIAVGAEYLPDRWTPLILRELMMGSAGFNEIHRGMPKISRTLLSQRLRQLQARGIVSKRSDGPGRAGEYRLTPAGLDLCQVVAALGQWATRWAFTEPRDDHLDGAWLLWQLHQYVDVDEIPDHRTCIGFDLRGPGGGWFWIVLDRGAATVCQADPGFEVDLLVRAENRELHRWFLGRTTMAEARGAGAIVLEGPDEHVDGFLRWFTDQPFRDAIASMRGREDEMLVEALSD